MRAKCRNLIVSAIMLLAVLLSAMACGQKNGDTRKAVDSADGGAIVLYLEGTVTQDGDRLAIGDAIRDGALIESDADGLAEIAFGGKNAIRVGHSTSLRLGFSTLDRTLRVERGTVTAVLRKLDKLAGGGMRISTPSVIAGIRGTSFCVWVSGKTSETYFCTCNGRIEFTPGGTEKAIIEEASHHEALVFTGTGDTVAFVPAPAGMDPRHSDADLESLAARIGEKMDWSRIEE